MNSIQGKILIKSSNRVKIEYMRIAQCRYELYTTERIYKNNTYHVGCENIGALDMLHDDWPAE